MLVSVRSRTPWASPSAGLHDRLGAVEERYALRVGRRNRYIVITSRHPLRYPAVARHTLGQRLRGLTRDGDDQTRVERVS